MRLCEHQAREYRKIIARKKEKRKSNKKNGLPKNLSEATCTVQCPSKLELVDTKGRNAFLGFLEKLRRCFKNQKKKIVIDFSAISRIESHAGLLLLAEIDRLRTLFPYKAVSSVKPHKRKEHEALCQIGVSRLCGMKKTNPRHRDVIHWNAASSGVVDGELYSKKLIEPFESRLPDLLQGDLWRSVSEAMANIPDHAYSSNRDDGINRKYDNGKWWMFSQIKDDRLTVVICDLGVGIPDTLTRQSRETLKPHLRPIQRWMNRSPKKDSEVLSAVMKKSSTGYPLPEETLSRTGEGHRGRGIYNILQIIQNVSGSHIIVMSNKGLWRASLNNPMSHEYKSSIYGTIISWIIPLAPEAEAQDDQ